MAFLLFAVMIFQAVPSEPAKVPAARPPLVYAGKPLMLEHQCGEETIQALGLGCTRDEPCPIYLELASLEVAGNSLFVTGNIHSELVTLESILLASDDGGKTWREAFPRVRQGVMDQIQFVDFQNGWVAGQVMQTIPRDPFFLITTDGGKTWRRRPLFDDNRIATIDAFHFTSKTQGSMILDRRKAGDPLAKYENYETATGGSSWTVREVSAKPLKLKNSAAPNGDWRVRADGPSKSFRIERRAGGTWTVTAAFLVRLADCQPPEPAPVVEPPPPTEPEPPSVVPPGPAAGTRKAPTLKKK